LQALATDPNFIRISKGAYSLHCFHPEREQLVKAPQPKEPKEPKEPKPSKKAAAATGTPGAGAADAATSTAKKAKDSGPMVRVEAKPLEVRPRPTHTHLAASVSDRRFPSHLRNPPRVLQEVEKQYKEGTVKHMLVTVLKAVQPEPLTAQGEDVGRAVLLHMLRDPTLCTIGHLPARVLLPRLQPS
jgi:hypothetical protein